MRLCSVLAAAAFGLAPLAAMADSVTDQLDLGRQYYDEGDYGGAITELEFAIGEIRALLADGFVSTFPEPPAGWTAGDVENGGAAAFMGGGTMLSRVYSNDAGGSIEAQLMVDNPMIQGFAAMINNPAMLAAQPGAKRVRIGRDNAVLKFDTGNGTGEIGLVLGGRALIRLEGRRLDNGDILVELLETWDVAGLKAAMGM